MAQSPDKYPEYTVNAIEAIADYGHYALAYLAEVHGWIAAEGGRMNGIFEPINAVHTFTAEDLQTVKEAVSWNTITKNPDLMGNPVFTSMGIKDADISLNLDFETSIYFYL